jgi:large-conductance mechanosensitive channel
LLAVLIGKEGLSGAITMLSPAYDAEGALDLANSIYIDWGAFISTVINFFLIAFVLFIIIRAMNRIAEMREKAETMQVDERKKRKEIKKIAKQQKVGKAAAAFIYAQQLEEAEEKAKEEARLAEEKAKEEARLAEEKAMANTRLLEEIRDLLKNK